MNTMPITNDRSNLLRWWQRGLLLTGLILADAIMSFAGHGLIVELGIHNTNGVAILSGVILMLIVSMLVLNYLIYTTIHLFHRGMNLSFKNLMLSTLGVLHLFWQFAMGLQYIDCSASCVDTMLPLHYDNILMISIIVGTIFSIVVWSRQWRQQSLTDNSYKYTGEKRI